MSAIIGTLCGLAFVILLGRLVTKWNVLSRIYDVRIANSGIEFLIFSKHIFYRLPFDDIYQVIVGFGGYHFLTATNFRNRFSRDGTLLILKKDGFITRKVLITPLEPASFVRELVAANVSVIGKEKLGI